MHFIPFSSGFDLPKFFHIRHQNYSLYESLLSYQKNLAAQDFCSIKLIVIIFPFRLFGMNCSKSQRQRNWIIQGFESNQQAAERSFHSQQQVARGEKRLHDHVGSCQSYSWDSDRCLAMVNDLPDGYAINFSQLSKDFNLVKWKEIPPKMVVKPPKMVVKL